MAIVVVALVLGVGAAAFGTDLPRNPIGFLAAFLLVAASLFAMGLVVAALAPSGRAATGMGDGRDRRCRQPGGGTVVPLGVRPGRDMEDEDGTRGRAAIEQVHRLGAPPRAGLRGGALPPAVGRNGPEPAPDEPGLEIPG